MSTVRKSDGVCVILDAIWSEFDSHLNLVFVSLVLSPATMSENYGPTGDGSADEYDDGLYG